MKMQKFVIILCMGAYFFFGTKFICHLEWFKVFGIPVFPKAARVGIEFDLSYKMWLKFTLEGTLDFVYQLFKLPKKFLIWVGPIPIEGTITLTLNAGVKIAAQAQFTLSHGQAKKYQFGVELKLPGGFSTFSDVSDPPTDSVTNLVTVLLLVWFAW